MVVKRTGKRNSGSTSESRCGIERLQCVPDKSTNQRTRVSWIAKCRKKPNLTKLSQINELRDHDPITDHGEKQRQDEDVASLRFD
ncbi:hypothetical protein J4731_21330 [Providencia rettgeri]|nr:hypothetical protein [Providencia rettgeri]